MEVVVTTGVISRAKLQQNRHHQQTKTQHRMTFLSSSHPTNSVKALKGKSITFRGLAHPKLAWHLPTLSLTTNSSWLPWGGLSCVSSASLLTPVPHWLSCMHNTHALCVDDLTCPSYQASNVPCTKSYWVLSLQYIKCMTFTITDIVSHSLAGFPTILFSHVGGLPTCIMVCTTPTLQC